MTTVDGFVVVTPSDEEIRKRVAEHPPTAECPDMECFYCSLRDCPSGCSLHYHHDGCPDCTRHADAEDAAQKSARQANILMIRFVVHKPSELKEVDDEMHDAVLLARCFLNNRVREFMSQGLRLWVHPRRNKAFVFATSVPGGRQWTNDSALAEAKRLCDRISVRKGMLTLVKCSSSCRECR
jgi:hypothetical protein